ncbi:MAG: hydrogenase expression/formation protein HypE [Zoogloeaceae bacterium]|jgi:hydrogenase expression/formation protein HypE|nr:hydrogenase expression/formation protein HypE [Zoogloeaceae bacterium]
MSKSVTPHKKPYLRPLDLQQGRVDMAHGAGGRATAQVIDEIFVRHFANEWLGQGNDGAVLPALAPGEKLVMATDGHVVSPLFFPGGDIGCLSVHGTINDVAVMGARPLWLSAAFILEEGFLLAELERIVVSMAKAAREAGVPIVTGDTKVVERGKGDGVFITTTGVGALPQGTDLGGQRAEAGDAILVSGTLGDHGMAMMSAREGLGFTAPIVSDTAALHGLIAGLLATGAEIHVLRDPTRGGLGATLNEIAAQSGVGMMLEEAQLPIQPAVAAACEFLGLDPLYVANEGKLIVMCKAADADKALAALRAHPQGRAAAIIGRVTEDPRHFVQMRTPLGGRRMVDWLAGEQLPRIC